MTLSRNQRSTLWLLAVGLLAIGGLIPLLWMPASTNASEDTASEAPRAPPLPGFHALLVGVSEYPSLSERHQLIGPSNDVVLMQRLLESRGFPPERITVLADGVDTADGLPTRATIKGAFDALIEQAGEGDFVYMHFSGHGAQQPVTEDTAAGEPDGLDEIFLPRDVGAWDGTIEQIENAIIDDEIGEVLDALMAKGAFVWAVFDNCHAATMTRAFPEDGWRDRTVSMDDLGIPEEAQRRAEALRFRGAGTPAAAAPVDVRGDAAAGGGYVAFFGAQSNEAAPELRLPRGRPGRQSHGLLTYTLASALETLPAGVSYRQLGEQISRQYVAENFLRTVPVFEGTVLDASVFEQTAGERVRQWPLTRLDDDYRIEAGLLHRIDEGALFAVVPSALSDDDNVIGHLRAREVSVVDARLEPYSPIEGRDAVTPDEIPRDAFARLLVSQPRLSLQLAPPLPEDALETPYSDTERAALALIGEVLAQDEVADDEPRLALEVVGPTEGADVVLRLRDERLWLLGPGAELVAEGPNRSLSIHADNHDALNDLIDSHLRPIAKVHNLIRLSAQLGTAGSEEVALEVRLLRRTEAGEYQPIAERSGLRLVPGDAIRLEFENRGRAPLDATVLFIDSRYGVHPVYPTGGQLNRLMPGYRDSIEGTITADTTGIERMLVIAVRTRDGMAPVDFTYLAQASLPETVRGESVADPTRGEIDVLALEDLLTEAGFGIPRLRFALTRPVQQTAVMDVLQWEVVP